MLLLDLERREKNERIRNKEKGKKIKHNIWNISLSLNVFYPLVKIKSKWMNKFYIQHDIIIY